MLEFPTQLYLILGWMSIVVAFLTFHLVSKNAALKRRIHPWLIAALGALFVIVASWSTGSWWYALVAIVLAIIGVPLAIKLVRFCSACGLTVFYGVGLIKLNYCPRCGSRLDQ